MAGIGFRHLCSLLLFCLASVVVVVVLRTLTLGSRTIEAAECKPMDTDFIRGDSELLTRFQQALRFETVSRGVGDFNPEETLKLHDFIVTSYKTMHSSPLVTREVIANYSLLYTVQGSDPSLRPFILTGHLDVVPVTEGHWDAPAFSADILNGFIYARGTIDDKHTVFGILEAVEFLLSQGHKPLRMFYMGFGHDEEVGGFDGAFHISETLMKRGVEIEFLLDEGMTILKNGFFPGVTLPVAMVGSSEKGHVSVVLSVSDPGGHSSMPRKESCIGILAKAITRLEENPHPSMFGTGPEKGTMEHIAPEMPLPLKMVMSNLWLFSPVVSRVLSQKPSTNAIVRTTTAVTKFNAGIKSNILAPYAEATVNHRIHPSQTVQEVVEYDRQIINDDRVKMQVTDTLEPLPLSPYGDDHFGWQTIKTSIKQVWGYMGVAVAPSVMVGNTDTRHYTKLTKNLYRFSPTIMSPDDVPRFHGLNERIAVKNYEEAVNFFYHLIVNADKRALEPMHKHGDEF